MVSDETRTAVMEAAARYGESGTVAYGARCTWWGPKERLATKPPGPGLFDDVVAKACAAEGRPAPEKRGLPCCPSCGGVMFEASASEWFPAMLDPARTDRLSENLSGCGPGWWNGIQTTRFGRSSGH